MANGNELHQVQLIQKFLGVARGNCASAFRALCAQRRKTIAEIEEFHPTQDEFKKLPQADQPKQWDIAVRKWLDAWLGPADAWTHRRFAEFTKHMVVSSEYDAAFQAALAAAGKLDTRRQEVQQKLEELNDSHRRLLRKIEGEADDLNKVADPPAMSSDLLIPWNKHHRRFEVLGSIMRGIEQTHPDVSPVTSPASQGALKSSKKVDAPDAAIDVEALERETPPWSDDPEVWVKTDRAAEITGISTKTLRNHRVDEHRTDDGMFGLDIRKRRYRRVPGATPLSNVWYYVPSLRAKTPRPGEEASPK